MKLDKIKSILKENADGITVVRLDDKCFQVTGIVPDNLDKLDEVVLLFEYPDGEEGTLTMNDFNFYKTVKFMTTKELH